MPPKKVTSAAKKATASAPAHASYQDMIKEAVINLKERTGSSRQSLKKYVLANNNLGSTSDAQFTSQFNRALQKGSDSGVFARPKGTSGPVKLANPKDKAAASTATKAAPKTAAAKEPAKNTAAAKKTTTAKKATTTKKAPAKKTTTTKAKAAPAKKAKANTSTKRKTPAAAPAVPDEKIVNLGKTKSGRVIKSAAPQPAKKAATKRKAPAAKKAKATPKKSTTPKKAAA